MCCVFLSVGGLHRREAVRGHVPPEEHRRRSAPAWRDERARFPPPPLRLPCCSRPSHCNHPTACPPPPPFLPSAALGPPLDPRLHRPLLAPSHPLAPLQLPDAQQAGPEGSGRGAAQSGGTQGGWVGGWHWWACVAGGRVGGRVGGRSDGWQTKALKWWQRRPPPPLGSCCFVSHPSPPLIAPSPLAVPPSPLPLQFKARPIQHPLFKNISLPDAAAELTVDDVPVGSCIIRPRWMGGGWGWGRAGQKSGRRKTSARGWWPRPHVDAPCVCVC